MSKSIKLAVFDQDNFIAKSFEMALKSEDRFEVLFHTNEIQNLIDFLANPEKAKPDVIILGIEAPYDNCLLNLENIQATGTSAKIMLSSYFYHPLAVVNFFRKGAKGLILKNMRWEEILESIENVHEKGFLHSKLVGKAMQTAADGRFNFDYSKLTRREKEFVKLACSDLTYEEIAERMVVAPKTVETYRTNSFHKLNVKNRITLLMNMARFGLVNMEEMEI